MSSAEAGILQGTGTFIFLTVALLSTSLSSSDEDTSDDSDKRRSEQKRVLAWAYAPESELVLVDSLEWSE